MRLLLQLTHPKAAVELLEQGRTILWSRIARYRQPLDLLRQVNPDLADRLQALTIALEKIFVVVWLWTIGR